MITERLIGQSCALSVLVFESIAGHSQSWCPAGIFPLNQEQIFL